jgi:hypothetical protein
MGSNNCWLVRGAYTKPQGKEQNFLPCAFKPEISLMGKDSEEIFNALKAEGLSGVNLSIAVGIAGFFVNGIQPEDIIIVANKLRPDVISLVQVVGGYSYDVAKGGHFREVRYLHEIPRASLPKQFRDTVLRTPRLVARVNFDEAVIKSLLDMSVLDKPTALAVKFPLRPDFSIDFTIPSDLTERESERLSSFIKTLFQKEG